jgi:hypothetical protein
VKATYAKVWGKPDGVIELGYGVDNFQPGQKVTGMHTNGPPSKWWRVDDKIGRPDPWVRQPDCRDRYWQELAAAANNCDEFLEELSKSS